MYFTMAGFAREAPYENTASFEEAGLDISFTSWRQRYKTEGDGICRDTGTYGMGRYIEELNEAYAHFSTAVTNGQPLDFVMDL